MNIAYLSITVAAFNVFLIKYYIKQLVDLLLIFFFFCLLVFVVNLNGVFFKLLFPALWC